MFGRRIFGSGAHRQRFFGQRGFKAVEESLLDEWAILPIFTHHKCEDTEFEWAHNLVLGADNKAQRDFFPKILERYVKIPFKYHT